jgi:hypothetical protein
MERSYTDLRVDELIETVENSLTAIIEQYGHVDDGYCLVCDDSPFDALNELRRRLESRPDWPTELHKQYLKVLDERDKALDKIDRLENGSE